MSARCTSKKPFLCESNSIYSEVDISTYAVQADIDQNGMAKVNIKVDFDKFPEHHESRDVPLTLVVPKKAGEYFIT